MGGPSVATEPKGLICKASDPYLKRRQNEFICFTTRAVGDNRLIAHDWSAGIFADWAVFPAQHLRRRHHRVWLCPSDGWTSAISRLLDAIQPGSTVCAGGTVWHAGQKHHGRARVGYHHPRDSGVDDLCAGCAALIGEGIRAAVGAGVAVGAALRFLWLSHFCGAAVQPGQHIRVDLGI